MHYAMVTGATGVLGAAFSKELAARGENLFLTGRSDEKLQALKNAIIAAYPGVNCIIYAADLTKEEDRLGLFSAAESCVFDLVVNCAGADIQKPFSRYDQKKLTLQTRINFESAVSVCAFAISHRAERLNIVNISSVCGAQPTPYFAVYSAAKGALTSFSVALNAEMRGSGVTVTAVIPGSVYTRPDVVKYINSLGFFAVRAAKSPEFVVKKALNAARKGRSRCVPGFLNKLAYNFSRLAPMPVKLRLAARSRRNREKDAF